MLKWPFLFTEPDLNNHRVLSNNNAQTFTNIFVQTKHSEVLHFELIPLPRCRRALPAAHRSNPSDRARIEKIDLEVWCVTLCRRAAVPLDIVSQHCNQICLFVGALKEIVLM